MAVIDCYYPGRTFPSISTTGTECSLDCKHCAGRHLEGMIPARTPEELIAVSEALVERGARGFLLSGGSDSMGKVNLASFVQAVREVKSTTGLLVNAHIGLTPRREIAALVESGIDAFSVDIYGDDATVREVTGLEAGSGDYLDVVLDLKDAGAPIVAPHLCVGVRRGRIAAENRAIEALRKLEPDTLVLISMIPTKGTLYAGAPAPSPDDILGTVKAARESLPETRLLIGCMRSKRDRSWESRAVDLGADGLVLPSVSTVAALRNAGHTLEKRNVCCALGRI